MLKEDLTYSSYYQVANINRFLPQELEQHVRHHLQPPNTGDLCKIQNKIKHI